MIEAGDLDRIAFVHAIDVPADAVIVLKMRKRLTPHQAATLIETAERIFPGHRAVALPADVDIDVLRPE